MKDKSGCSFGAFSELFSGKKRFIAVALLVIAAVVMIFLSSAGTSGKETSGDDVEERLEELCSSLSGVGQCRVMVTYKNNEKRYGASEREVVESVAIVCKGADKPGVREELTRMLSSLFGIGTNRIHVSKMK